MEIKEIDDIDTSIEKNVVEIEMDNCDVNIPLATNISPGIASFDSEDFTVAVGSGHVKSKMKYGTPQYLGIIKEITDYNGNEVLSWALDSRSVKPITKVEIGDIIMLTQAFKNYVPGSLFKINLCTDKIYTSLEVLCVLSYNFDKTYITQEPGDDEFKVLSQKATKKYYAPLNENGLVPSSVLPSYVDDVVEGKLIDTYFYKLNNDGSYTKLNEGEKDKIYVDVITNSTYRWSGSMYIQVGSSDLNIENGSADVLIQTTDTNHSFKVMTDGRAKVQTAPVEDDDVVRNKELTESNKELTERSFVYYSIEAETARDYSKGSKIDKMFKDILKRIETIENKLI